MITNPSRLLSGVMFLLSIPVLLSSQDNYRGSAFDNSIIQAAMDEGSVPEHSPSADLEIKVHPNPDYKTIFVFARNADIKSLVARDLYGHLLQSTQFSVPDDRRIFDTKDIKAGIAFLEVQTNMGVSVHKVYLGTDWQ